MSWTDERVELLKKMWGELLSINQQLSSSGRSRSERVKVMCQSLYPNDAIVFTSGPLQFREKMDKVFRRYTKHKINHIVFSEKETSTCGKLKRQSSDSEVRACDEENGASYRKGPWYYPRILRAHTCQKNSKLFATNRVLPS